jgi:hypothetical protein
MDVNNVLKNLPAVKVTKNVAWLDVKDSKLEKLHEIYVLDMKTVNYLKTN